MDIQSFLSALPEAARSPRALIAYLAVLGCWTYFWKRVQRNKLLLENLQHIPAKDRLAALRNEMGGIPLPDSISPDDWLTARIHRYYFRAFVLFIALMTILLLLTVDSERRLDDLSESKEALQEASLSLQAAADPYSPDTRAVESISLGATQKFIRSKLGLPLHESDYSDVACDDYKFHNSTAYVIYGKSDHTVVFYKVISTSPSFHGQVNQSPDDPICVGCQTYADVAGATPVYFNFAAHFWTYTEKVSYGAGIIADDSSFQTLYLVETDRGADYDDGDDAEFLHGAPVTNVLFKVTGSRNSDVPEKLTSSEQDLLERYRKNKKFNSFAWSLTSWKPASDLAPFDLKEAGTPSCPSASVQTW